jgi:hypothetical protein
MLAKGIIKNINKNKLRIKMSHKLEGTNLKKSVENIYSMLKKYYQLKIKVIN